MSPPSSSTSRRLTQRKRAPIACQFCRLRKTKCDGVKPVCSFCRYHEAQCVWGAVEDPGVTSTEKEILRRLDELKTMLSVSGDATNSPLQTLPVAHNDAASTTTGASHGNTLTSSNVGHATAFLNTSCESILSWPIFQDVIDPAEIAIESFAVEYGQISESDSSSGAVSLPQASRHGVQDHLFLPLCRKFLDLVHVRNPILDEEELMRYAKRDLEHGIQWDGPSCLVVGLGLSSIVSILLTN